MGTWEGQDDTWPRGLVEELGLLVLPLPTPSVCAVRSQFPPWHPGLSPADCKNLSARGVVMIITILMTSTPLPDVPLSSVRVLGQH